MTQAFLGFILWWGLMLLAVVCTVTARDGTDYERDLYVLAFGCALIAGSLVGLTS